MTRPRAHSATAIALLAVMAPTQLAVRLRKRATATPRNPSLSDGVAVPLRGGCTHLRREGLGSRTRDAVRPDERSCRNGLVQAPSPARTSPNSSTETTPASRCASCRRCPNSVVPAPATSSTAGESESSRQGDRRAEHAFRPSCGRHMLVSAPRAREVRQSGPCWPCGRTRQHAPSASAVGYWARRGPGRGHGQRRPGLVPRRGAPARSGSDPVTAGRLSPGAPVWTGLRRRQAPSSQPVT